MKKLSVIFVGLLLSICTASGATEIEEEITWCESVAVYSATTESALECDWDLHNLCMSDGEEGGHGHSICMTQMQGCCMNWVYANLYWLMEQYYGITYENCMQNPWHCSAYLPNLVNYCMNGGPCTETYIFCELAYCGSVSGCLSQD